MAKKTRYAEPRSACDYGIDITDTKKWQHYLDKSKGGRPICIISSWIYWDITYQAEDVQKLKERGFLPAAIFSENLIWDEQDRWSPGSCVKTTWLKRFEFNCIFHTQNTTYLLVGAGTRCPISPGMFNSIHF